MNAGRYISYETFGRAFVEAALSEERVAEGFAAFAGNEFLIGPIGQGPGKIAKITARATPGKPGVVRRPGRVIMFDVSIPIMIDMMVDLRLDKQRFKVSGVVRLRAEARTAAPLLLLLEVAKPRETDVSVSIASSSVRGEVLRIVAGMDREICRFVAAHIAREIDRPQSRAARVVNCLDAMNASWEAPAAPDR